MLTFLFSTAVASLSQSLCQSDSEVVLVFNCTCCLFKTGNVTRRRKLWKMKSTPSFLRSLPLSPFCHCWSLCVSSVCMIVGISIGFFISWYFSDTAVWFPCEPFKYLSKKNVWISENYFNSLAQKVHCILKLRGNIFTKGCAVLAILFLLLLCFTLDSIVIFY